MPFTLWEDSIYCSLSEPVEVVKSEKSLGIQYLNILTLPGFVRNTLARVWYKAGLDLHFVPSVPGYALYFVEG